MKSSKQHSLIFFDGVCNLCNASINFIIKRDKMLYFKFASLQSDVAQQILLQKNILISNTNSILLIYNNIIYTKSSAILKILSILGGTFSICKVLFIVPKNTRDYIYDIIAKNRYKWFGKRKSCMIPDSESKKKVS